MQRKMQLIRKLLEHVEMSQTENRILVPEIQDYSESEVHYHVGLCEEADFLVIFHCQYEPEPGRRFPGISRLTWKGHEALDSMRGSRSSVN